jgi:Cu-Zn family superoxide dismutase
MKTSLLLPFALTAGSLSLFAATNPVTVTLKDAKGGTVGTAKLTPANPGVKIKLEVANLTAGEHTFHIHQNAKCDAPDFKSAGPHFNPAGKKHGMNNPDGRHNGDMANFKVGKNGKGKATIINTDVTLDDGANSVFANGGTALMIHAKPDDLKTDPAGNAGDRIACGVITK